MIKISITKNGIQTNQAQFNTQIEADAWLVEGVQANWWGLPERPEMVIDETGMEVPTGVILQAEYQIVVEDVSAQVAQAKINAENLKFLAESDFYIIRFQETGVPVPQAILDQRAAARLAIVR